MVSVTGWNGGVTKSDGRIQAPKMGGRLLVEHADRPGGGGGVPVGMVRRRPSPVGMERCGRGCPGLVSLEAKPGMGRSR